MNIELPLDGKQRSRVRPVSKALFNSEYGLEILLLVMREGRLYSGQVAAIIGCQPNFAGAFLRRLQTGGLIEQLPVEAGQRRHYYRQLPSPIWDALAQIFDDLLTVPDGQVTQLPKR